MIQPATETAVRASLARAQDQLAMLQLLLQALTNNCTCQPCQGLRSMASALALAPQDRSTPMPNTNAHHAKTAPPEASAEANHGDAPRKASFDGVTEGM